MDHKETVKRVFTGAADSYAARKAEVDRLSHEWMVKLSQVGPGDRVLDVATGPGFIAMRFAERAKEVVGVDLTPAFIAKAQANSARRGSSGQTFQGPLGSWSQHRWHGRSFAGPLAERPNAQSNPAADRPTDFCGLGP